jgi:hypothetical protein
VLPRALLIARPICLAEELREVAEVLSEEPTRAGGRPCSSSTALVVAGFVVAVPERT